MVSSSIDLVIDTFGMYSGKTLELITHREQPWQQAREGYLETERADVVVSKEAMGRYFEYVSKYYDMKNAEGIRQYIIKQLEAV